MPLPPRRGSLITGSTTTGAGGGSGSSAFINVKDHGATGNGTTDDTAAINATILYAHGLPSGGGRIYFPAGQYKVTVGATGGILIPSSPGFSNLIFYGDGDATVIKLSGTPTAGFGVFDVKASNVIFEDFVLDGGQITSIGLDWSTITDPMQSNLTQGSSFWVHGGCSNLRWSRVTIQHTWGYAILLDATSSGDIDNWEVDSCLLQNNRAHTFGTGGVNSYQSWTSGIHYQGDGVFNCVKNGMIHDCRFRRTPGCCIWGHLYAFTRLHSNIMVDNCSFTDFGLEGVEHGGLNGGGVTNCHFRRGGFVTGNSDLTAATPAWLSGHASTAIDTTGLTTNLVYGNNTIINQNGGYIDLDGFGQGTVDGNTCVISQSGDPLYTEDSVASFGPGGAGALYCYGINGSNTSGQTLGAAYNTIVGNLLSNIGGGAIRLYAARNCKVSGNNIYHPPTGYLSPPIAMGPVSAGANYRATGNVITNNVIDWSPSTMQAAIKEDPVLTAFVGTDKNWVFGNQWGIGSNVYEFLKDTNSGSVSRVVLSSNVSGLSGSSEAWMQREGTLAAPITRWYKNVNGTSVAIMTLQDHGTYATAPATPGPLLNVTNGSGNGGVITTGARTTAAYDDAVLSGKGYFDSHLALTDTTRVQADEDILSATTGLVTNVALLRYRPSVGFIEKSTSISAGVRVWTALASAVPGGSDTQVQFNGPQSTGGTLTGSANFTYSTSAKALTITGTTATAGIIVLTSYVQSAEGFLTLSTNYQSIQTPSGGFLGAGIGIANASGPHGGYVDIAPLSSGFFPVPIAPLGSFGASDALLWVAAANGTTSPVTGTQLQTNIAVNSAVGFVTTNTLTNSIQAPNGGVAAKWLTASDSLFFLEEAAPALSGVGQSRIYMDSTSHTLKVSMNNAAYVPLVGGGGTVAGSNSWVQFNSSGAFGASANLVWNNTPQTMVITGLTGTAGLSVLTSYVSAAEGFTTTSLNYQSIQTAGGGFYGAALGITNGGGVGGYIDIPPLSYGGSFPYPVPLLGASFASNHVLLFSSAVNGTGLSSNPAALTTIGLCTNAFINAAAGFSTGGAADNIIQAPSGGVTGRRVIATFDIVHTGITGTAPTGAAGQGKLYFDNITGSPTQGKWMVIQGASSAVQMIGGGSGTPGGSDTQVQYNGPQGTGGSFSGSANHVWNNTLQRLTVFGISNTAGIAVGTGYIQSDGGFLVTSTNTAWNTIQTSGGIRLSGALQVGGSYTTDQSAAANGFLVNTMAVGTSAGVVTDVWDTTNGNQFIPAILIGRRASGSGTPGVSYTFIGTPSGTFLFSIGARGSVSGGFASSACASINFVSTENHSSFAQGSEIQFAVVPNLSTTRITRLWMRNSGLVEMQGTGTSLNPGCQLNTGYFVAGDSSNGGFYANGSQSTVFNAPFGGITVGLGVTTNQALYPKTLGTGTNPNTPGGGYGGFGHRSGSTYWYYNGSTWASVDFAASGGGGGVSSLNGLTGGITLFWVGGVTIASGSITFGTSGVAMLASSNAFTGLSTSFNNAVTFAASSSNPIVIGSAGVFVNGVKTISASGVITGNGILLQNGAGATGFNIYLGAGSGFWTYAGGATLNLPGADGHTYNFQGGALVGKDGAYINQFNVTPP